MLLAVFSSQPDPSEIRLLRSTIVPSFQKYACSTPLAVSDSPTTWPKALTLFAELLAPPSVPRSLILPSRYRNACCGKLTPVNDFPTTWLMAFMQAAALSTVGPPSVLRSLILPALYRNACGGELTPVNELPTTWPMALMLVAALSTLGPLSVRRSLILPLR